MAERADQASSDAEPVRAKLLDAAERCFGQFGLTKTTMEDVARSAGLSRATVYRYFKNRDELLMGVVDREARSAAREIESRLEGVSNPGEYLVEGIIQALDVVPKRPALSMLFSPDTVGMTSRLFTNSERMAEIALDLLIPVIEPARKKGLLREEVDTALVIEWTFRIISSYLTVPSAVTRSQDEMRELLRTMLLPALVKSKPQPVPPGG